MHSCSSGCCERKKQLTVLAGAGEDANGASLGAGASSHGGLGKDGGDAGRHGEGSHLDDVLRGSELKDENNDKQHN